MINFLFWHLIKQQQFYYYSTDFDEKDIRCHEKPIRLGLDKTICEVFFVGEGTQSEDVATMQWRTDER